jgi:hypothetical protein
MSSVSSDQNIIIKRQTYGPDIILEPDNTVILRNFKKNFCYCKINILSQFKFSFAYIFDPIFIIHDHKRKNESRYFRYKQIYQIIHL